MNGEQYKQCTVGAIINIESKNYILTAGHCISDGIFAEQNDLQKQVKQIDEVIGYSYKGDYLNKIDASLISINNGINTSIKGF
jgi:hypothetical protein